MSKTGAIKKTVNKASSGMSYVKEGIDKVRAKEWAEPVGTALKVTSSICEGLGTFVPGVGFVGGALKMGSCLLNPAPSLADLKRTQKEIEETMNGSSGVVKDLLEKKLDELKEDMKNPQAEILQDCAVIKAEVQATATKMSDDMRQIEESLVDVKNIVDHTYQIVRDARYRDGIEKIDGAYQIFLKGSNNLEATITLLENFMYELQVLAVQNLNGQRLREYLKAIQLTEDSNVCRETVKYIMIVRSKYLQLSTVYYIYKNDTDRVALEFETFNREYEELRNIFKNEIGYEFDPEQVPSTDLVSKCQNKTKAIPDIMHSPTTETSSSEDPVENFLRDIGLSHLYEMLKEEAVTMDILTSCEDSELVQLGVKKFGNRIQILNAIKSYKEPGTSQYNCILSRFIYIIIKTFKGA